MLQASYCALPWWNQAAPPKGPALPKIAAKVGVAPGTTTMNYDPYATIESLKGLRGQLGVSSPSDWWRTGRAVSVHNYNQTIPRFPASVPSLNGLGVSSDSDWWRTGRETSVHHYDKQMPAGTVVGGKGTLKGHPGFGISTEEINRSLSGLGDVPTDADLACVYGYTPVMHGWIAEKGGIDEWGSLGSARRSRRRLRGLRGLGADAMTPEEHAQADAIAQRNEMDTMEAEQKKIMKLQKFSAWTAGVAAVFGAALSAATLVAMVRKR